jgi:hypothetical protein
VRNALILRAFNAYAIGRTLRKPELDFEPGEDEFPKLVGRPLNQVLQ